MRQRCNDAPGRVAPNAAAQFDRIVDALTDKLPKVAAHLGEARGDILAFPSNRRVGDATGLESAEIYI